jgi:hypothetical protein
MSDVEGISEVVTGAAVARAVEPDAGETAGPARVHGNACLNCGTVLAGEYCHACGQQAHIHRSLAAFWHDLLHSVLHFEGKIWRTLPMLAWWPGDLTRRYVEGERARFVSPLALFLFAVFLMFATVSTLGGPFGGAKTSSAAELDAERRELRDKLVVLTKRRDAAIAAKQNTAELDEEISDVRQELGALNLINGDSPTKDGGDLTAEPGDTAGPLRTGVTNAAASAEAGKDGWFNDAYKKAKENPSLLFYKMQNNAYKFSWALIPISVPFLWLLFLHRKRYRQYRAYDHSVFITYSIGAMTLFVVGLSLLRAAGLSMGWVLTGLTFLPLIHMYRQLRGAYCLGRWSAIWRTFALSQFALWAASLFLFLLLLMGVA